MCVLIWISTQSFANIKKRFRDRHFGVSSNKLLNLRLLNRHLMLMILRSRHLGSSSLYLGWILCSVAHLYLLRLRNLWLGGLSSTWISTTTFLRLIKRLLLEGTWVRYSSQILLWLANLFTDRLFHSILNWKLISLSCCSCFTKIRLLKLCRVIWSLNSLSFDKLSRILLNRIWRRGNLLLISTRTGLYLHASLRSFSNTHAILMIWSRSSIDHCLTSSELVLEKALV